MKPLKVGIIGIEGRMGCILRNLISINENLLIKRGFTNPNSSNIGKISIEVFGDSNLNNHFFIDSSENLLDPEKIREMDLDLIFDFSRVEVTEKIAPFLIEQRIPLVIGTTGLNLNWVTEIQEKCKDYQTSCVVSSNYSIGINILYHIIPILTELTRSWEIEIIEEHHNKKKDAPSGTAIEILKRIANHKKLDIDSILDGVRNGISTSFTNQISGIGIHSLRLGTIVGTHKCTFAKDDEFISIQHVAQNRAIFGHGALKSALFLDYYRNSGEIYSMNDVLKSSLA